MIENNNDNKGGGVYTLGWGEEFAGFSQRRVAYHFSGKNGPKETVYEVKQVHSSKVVELSGESADVFAVNEADAIITEKLKKIGVKTADC